MFWNKYWFENKSQFDPLPFSLKNGVRVRDKIGIYSQISIYSKRINHHPLTSIVLNWDLNKLWPIVKDGEKWNLRWNFSSLILSCHTWNIPKKHTSQIFTACRSDLDTLLGMFHVWQLRIKLLKFQWRFHFSLSFTMGHDLFFWNKYWFPNRSPTLV